jgi:hypothetical protein
MEGCCPHLRLPRGFDEQFVGGGVPRTHLLLPDMWDLLAVKEHRPFPGRDHLPVQHGASTGSDHIRFYHQVDELYPFALWFRLALDMKGCCPHLRLPRGFDEQFVGGSVLRAYLLLPDMRDLLPIEEHRPFPVRDHFPVQYGASTGRDHVRFYHQVDELYPFALWRLLFGRMFLRRWRLFCTFHNDGDFAPLHCLTSVYTQPIGGRLIWTHLFLS